MACMGAPKTVDAETDSRIAYVQEMEKSVKAFNANMTLTMNNYRQLLTTFDSVAQLYGNATAYFSPEVREPINAFRDGMRDMKDKGPFNALNHDLHTTTLAVLDPVKVELKKVEKSIETLKEKQKKYDAIRFKLEQTEKKYAKSTKPLSENKEYEKNLLKRDKYKVEYEKAKETVEQEITLLKHNSEQAFLLSMNNYLRSSAKFCEYLHTTMNMYRTDDDQSLTNNRLDQLVHEAEKRSVTQRAKRTSSHNVVNSNRNNKNDADYPAEYANFVNNGVNGMNTPPSPEAAAAAVSTPLSPSLNGRDGGSSNDLHNHEDAALSNSNHAIDQASYPEEEQYQQQQQQEHHHHHNQQQEHYNDEQPATSYPTEDNHNKTNDHHSHHNDEKEEEKEEVYADENGTTEEEKCAESVPTEEKA